MHTIACAVQLFRHDMTLLLHFPISAVANSVDSHQI